MIEVDDIIEGNRSRRDRHPHFGRRENAGRLVLSVAYQEGFFFLRTDTTGKFTGDIAFQVESAVVQQFFRHTDSRAQLVRPDGLLAEGILAVRVEAVLFHPGRFAMTRHDGNLAVTAGMDDRRQTAEEVLFLKLVDELVFEFVRHQIAAISIGACTQCVLYIDEVLMADAVPESLTIGIGRTAFLFRHFIACSRNFSNRHRCRLGQLGIKLLLAFQAVDFLAEIYYIRFHLVVANRVFRRHHAVLITDGIQKILGGIPEVLAFLTQC